MNLRHLMEKLVRAKERVKELERENSHVTEEVSRLKEKVLCLEAKVLSLTPDGANVPAGGGEGDDVNVNIME